MKKTLKYLFLVVILICNLFVNGGCWSYREPEDLGVVTAVAIDKIPGKNSFYVTIEIINSEAASNQTQLTPEIYKTEGNTIFSAVRRMVLSSGKRAYWSHAKVVILGEEVARDSVIPAIDWMNRDSELRPNMWIIITKGFLARDILTRRNRINEVVGFTLDKIIESNQITHGTLESQLWTFKKDLLDENISAVAPKVSIERLSLNHYGPEVSGTAVFKIDKLVGWLNEKESFYVSLLRNKAKTGVINIMNVSGSGTNVTLELFDNKTIIKPEYNNGIVTLNIELKPVAAIDEIAGSYDVTVEDGLKKLKKQAESQMEQEIEHLIYKAQNELQADFLGFSDTVMKKKPGIWKKVGGGGINTFENMKVNVKVDLSIKGSAKDVNPIEAK